MERLRITRLLVYALIAITAACASQPPSGRATAVATLAARTIDVEVQRHVFSPATIDVRRDETVTLVFTRTAERTCAKRVVISIDGSHKVERDLPLNKHVPVTLHFDQAGEIEYACSMGMMGGVIKVGP